MDEPPMWTKISQTANRALARLLDGVERAGNALPHPATLFAILAVLVVVLSSVGHALGVAATHPVTGDLVETRNLLSAEGARWIYSHIIGNFLRFPPLGYVLVVMVGIGVAEGSGLFNTAIRALVISAPARLVTVFIILAGILSHLASDSGYVILIPLGALAFHALGRHPIAGLAAAFCGVSGGFGANFFIGSIDPVLSGISESAAQMIVPDISVNPAVNFYFMAASVLLVVTIGTYVTERIIEPRLGKYQGSAEKLPMDKLTAKERRGLRFAGIALLLTIAVLVLAVAPESGVLRDPATKGVLRSPFMRNAIVSILLLFFVPGLVYGLVVGSIRSDKDVAGFLGKTMSSMGGYIVLVFFAAQFVYFFDYSHLGVILGIKGAEALQAIGLTGRTLVVSFVLLSAAVNLFMGSASAKWAIMAPIFVPMLMLIDPPYHPALVQAAYRVGDSVTNLITPMLPYFALIITFAQKYDEKCGLGTLISTMLPYTLLLLLSWTGLLVLWVTLGIPLGPDAPILLPR